MISGGAGLVFKGSGFYITDYKRAGERGGDDKAKSDSSPGGAKPEGKSESTAKPKSKPDSGAQSKKKGEG